MSNYNEGLAKMNRNDCTCTFCKQPFTELNIFTVEGIREIAITNTCESCFDSFFDDCDDDFDSGYDIKNLVVVSDFEW